MVESWAGETEEDDGGAGRPRVSRLKYRPVLMLLSRLFVTVELYPPTAPSWSSILTGKVDQSCQNQPQCSAGGIYY